MRTRPSLSFVLAGAAVLYLAVAVWPFESETRLVGLGGAAVFGLLFAAESRRPRRPTRSGSDGRSAIGGKESTDALGGERWEQWSSSAMLMLVAALGILGLVLLARHDPVRESSVLNDKAVAAALTATRGGRATEVEVDTERGAAWEVDVIEPDGSAVDVLLDSHFGLVAIEDEAHHPDRH